MRRRFRSSALSPLMLVLTISVASAQSAPQPAKAQSAPNPAKAQSALKPAKQTSQLTAPQLPSPGTPKARPIDVPKNTTPPQPGSAQPVVPGAWPPAPPKPSSPVVEEIVREKQPLVVRKGLRRRPVAAVRAHRRYAGGHHRYYSGRILDRPALAGVELVAPLPPPPEGPHVTVPVPAYPVESVVARITTPPPPIRCHPTRRDPYAPDPRLYKEVPVQCEPEED